jgi:hypothetical protein
VLDIVNRFADQDEIKDEQARYKKLVALPENERGERSKKHTEPEQKRKQQELDGEFKIEEIADKRKKKANAPYFCIPTICSFTDYCRAESST